MGIRFAHSLASPRVYEITSLHPADRDLRQQGHIRLIRQIRGLSSASGRKGHYNLICNHDVFFSTANITNSTNRESASRIPWLRRGSMKLPVCIRQAGTCAARPHSLDSPDSRSFLCVRRADSRSFPCVRQACFCVFSSSPNSSCCSPVCLWRRQKWHTPDNPLS